MTAHIDFEQGLRHCDDNRAIYTAVLQQFLLQYRAGLDQSLLLNQEQAAALELHTLKGLCATIGALQLSSLAADSYQHWRQLTTKNAQQELQQINNKLMQVIQEVERYLTIDHVDQK